MTSFSRFQERNKKRTVANSKFNSNFILKGYPSIEITNDNGDVLQASVVSRQEKDYAYLYTKVEDVLSIGSVWSAKNLHWLVAEEIVMIHDVEWRKYHSLLCNVQVGNTWGYFKGPEKSFLDIALEKDVIWESPQKPVLVLPDNVLNFRDKVVIKGRAWLIQEYDAISTPGLVYYSLKPTTVSKETIMENVDKEVYVEKHEEEGVLVIEEPLQPFTDDFILVSPNISITVPTENGYFKSSNKNLKIVKRTSSQVVFSIPFGLPEVEIEIKEKGDIITKKYRVV